MRADISNVAIAAALGVQHTTVSRWRSGGRVPNRATMLQIFDRFHFLTDEQMKAAEDGTYAEKFEAALVKSLKVKVVEDANTDVTTT